MLFNSTAFLFLFLPLTLAIALRLRGQALLGWITLASFVFYSFAGHAWFLVPMLVTTLVDFLVAPYIAAATSPRRKRALLVFSLAGNLGLLFFFKYSGLLLHTLTGAYSLLTGGDAPGWARVFDVVLPAGISFYTFQTMSYVIDVYRGEARPERNFWKFAGFVSFFPHLVAGPLTRHNQLLPALTSIAGTGIRPRWEEGVFLFSVGLAKKVLIADRIGNLIDPVLSRPTLGLVDGWMALLGYSLQIYFDFSGYSDMAIGLGRLFGVELPQNFNSPYRATDPSDFWRRWHITLSLWLRDYLYISLGGSRCSPRRRSFNLLLTMVLGGLWHGASFSFALWGLYHGLLLAAYQAHRQTWDRLAPALRRALTFVLVTFGWLFFRARTTADLLDWLSAVLGVAGWGEMPAGAGRLALLLTAGVAIASQPRNASGFAGWASTPAWGRAALGVLTAIAILFMNYSSSFLYYQF